MTKRSIIHRQIKKGLKGNSVVNLAFKFRIRFDLKPFLQQKTFKQKQWRIGFFPFFRFTGLIIFYKKHFTDCQSMGLFTLRRNNKERFLSAFFWIAMSAKEKYCSIFLYAMMSPKVDFMMAS